MKKRNEANFIHRGYVESHYPVSPRGIEPDHVRQNKANLQEAGSWQLEAFPPNEPNSLEAGSWKLAAGSFFSKRTQFYTLLYLCALGGKK